MICPHCHIVDNGGLHSSEFCIEVLAEVIRRVPVTGGMILPRRPVDHQAYRDGRCVDCSIAPHSAGLPRCAPCHEALIAAQPSFQPQLRRGRLGSCAANGCGNPAGAGCVLCGPCAREKKRKKGEA